MVIYTFTAQKMKFSIKDFFSKCDQIRSFMRIWSHLLEKFLMENFIFCAVFSFINLTPVNQKINLESHYLDHKGKKAKTSFPKDLQTSYGWMCCIILVGNLEFVWHCFWKRYLFDNFKVITFANLLRLQCVVYHQEKDSQLFLLNINPLSANPKKWSNTLKQFVGNSPTNCFSVFHHFVKLALKGLSYTIARIFLMSQISLSCPGGKSNTRIKSFYYIYSKDTVSVNTLL